MESQLDLFHNTTCLEGSALRRREIRAGSQNSVILAYFQASMGIFTPNEILERLVLIGLIAPNTPITSIRRAMTDLTKLGYLVKTDERRPGEYGELNYCWKLA